jgi:hypothetical protein
MDSGEIDSDTRAEQHTQLRSLIEEGIRSPGIPAEIVFSLLREIATNATRQQE